MVEKAQKQCDLDFETTKTQQLAVQGVFESESVDGAETELFAGLLKNQLSPRSVFSCCEGWQLPLFSSPPHQHKGRFSVWRGEPNISGLEHTRTPEGRVLS